MNLVSRNQFLSFFLFMAIGILPGCVTVGTIISPITTGVVYWIGGEAHKYYENDTDILYRTTKHALEELNQPIFKDETYKDGKYKIVAGDRERISITINKFDNRLSKINIRVNFIGDKDFAELVYKKIDQKINSIEFDPQGRPTINSIRNQRRL